VSESSSSGWGMGSSSESGGSGGIAGWPERVSAPEAARNSERAAMPARMPSNDGRNKLGEAFMRRCLKTS
jgi:hypothetical protein